MCKALADMCLRIIRTLLQAVAGTLLLFYLVLLVDALIDSRKLKPLMMFPNPQWVAQGMPTWLVVLLTLLCILGIDAAIQTWDEDNHPQGVCAGILIVFGFFSAILVFNSLGIYF